MSLRLTRSLEVDVANVIVSEGKTYQALIGMDLLRGKADILEPATIKVGATGSEGAVRFRLSGSCDITEARFILATPSVNAVAKEALPPPPALTADSKVPQLLLADAELSLSEEHRIQLSALAKERDTQRKGQATDDEWRDLMDRAWCLLRATHVPHNVARLLRQAFAVRYLQCKSTETVLANVMRVAQTQGYEPAIQKLEDLGVASFPATRPFPKKTGDRK